MILDNKINVERLWFDLEPASAAATGCNAWNLSKTANLALARKWVAALKATGLKWGIYANGYEAPRSKTQSNVVDVC